MGKGFIDHTASLTQESFETNCCDGFFVTCVREKHRGSRTGKPAELLSLAVRGEFSSRFENSSINCLIKALKMTFYEQILGNYYISCLHFSNRTQLYFLKTWKI